MAIVEMIMPKMGESIIEATIISWLKSEGDTVQEDETILEIATDKVDSEVPSPVSGVIKELLFKKDEVVSIGQAVALIETNEDNTASMATVDPVESKSLQEEIIKSAPKTEPTSSSAFKKRHVLSRKSLSERIPSTVGGRFFSPLVRNIARAEGISIDELESLEGSGAEGRVTKYDLLNYVDQKKISSTSSRSATSAVRSSVTSSAQREDSPINKKEIVQESTEKITLKSSHATELSGEDTIVELSRMRRVISDHMRHSLDTSAHVTTFLEADATRIVNWRKKYKDEYQTRFGEKLSLSPLFTEAVIKALHDFPEINASFDGDRMILKKSINIGIATAMENGNLIVPVIKDAGHLNLQGLTTKLNDLTGRARINKLKPDEIQGGTFTVSNIGTFGNIMGTPIISQPQLAILALGAIKKKPVIQETQEGDIIAIRHMMFLSLSFDHRVIDGYKGGIFLNRIAHYLETFDNNRTI